MVTPDNVKRTLRQLKRRRDILLAEVTTTFELIGNVESGNTDHFLVRCEVLKSLRTEFRSLQLELVEANEEASPADQLPVESVSKTFDDMYFKIKALERSINRIRSESLRSSEVAGTSHSRSNAGESSNHSLKLPRITIPTWNGDMNSFNNFFSLYNSLVHDADYPLAAKLTYLRSFLTGTPLAMIEHIPISDENYDIAYRIIEDKYASVRTQATHYLKKLFEFSPITGDSVLELQSFLAVFKSNMEAFKNLRLEDPYDFIMFTWAMRCLPAKIRVLFDQNRINDTKLPTYDSLLHFVHSQCKIKELTAQLQPPKASSTPKCYSNYKKPTQNSLMLTPVDDIKYTATPKSCVLCHERHSLRHCEKYLSHSSMQRRKLVNRFKKCLRCIGDHSTEVCSSKGRCVHCRSSLHHSTLHDVVPSTSGTGGAQTQPSNATTTTSCNLKASSAHINPGQDAAVVRKNLFDSSSSAGDVSLLTRVPQSPPKSHVVVLGTAQGFIKNRHSRWVPIRLVVDGGSQVNLISADCVQRLGLKVQPSLVPLVGALQTSVGTSKGTVQLVLTSGRPNSEHLLSHAVVVRNVCSNLPTVPLSMDIFSQFAHLDLADRTFHIPGKIDFLLGAALYPSLFQPGYGILRGEPTAIQTSFGWIVMGNSPSIGEVSTVDTFTGLICGLTLEESLQRFWQTEEVKSVQHVDPLHEIVEKHFLNTHSVSESGRYIVRLPFSDSQRVTPFGLSKEIAVKRWYNLEQKLRKVPDLYTAYQHFLEEYLRLGHMQLATVPGKYFIPHFAVLRDSVSSPLRVVFDASCKDTSGMSLNDRLHIGPPLQKDISEVISLFRLNSVAITADIKQMYRQILLFPDDCVYQHIVWRQSEKGPLQEYQLQTVTYGLKPAPYLAQRVLLQLVEDQGKTYPLASQALRESCYMDDVCCSVSDFNQAVQLRFELTELLSLAGFELRKWASNSAILLQDLPDDHRADVLTLRTEQSATLHILGLQWNPQTDTFTYRIEVPEPANTKRSILSRVASIFDPLGWAAPVVFWAKVFMRELWTHQLDWDVELPSNLSSRWADFAQQLPTLQDISIPRFCVVQHAKCYQLIGFCDASELGFAASVYIRSESDEGVQVELIKAKTRVAPLQVQTIQRLELNGAVLLAELLDSMKFLIYQLSIESFYLFTDSATVLAWLKTPPHKLKTFVANRVVKVLGLTQLSSWRHILSASNAADCASRGLSPQELVTHTLWWNGPSFLKDDPVNWPSSLNHLVSSSALSEMKPVPEMNSLTVTSKSEASKQDRYLLSIIAKYSSLQRLQRVIAWVMRFITNTQTKYKFKFRGTLKVPELTSALQIILRLTQVHYFSDDLKSLSKGRPCSKRLRQLLPFIDEVGLLRVGGRLQQSLLSESSKHPVILPKEAPISRLLCEFFHVRMLHSGPQAVQAEIQRQYWILSLRSLIRHTIWHCSICAKARAKVQHPVMAELPQARVTPSRPFSTASVDMAGPLFIKESTRRNSKVTKAYFAIFVCLSTKAAHLELVGSLSTESYKAALDRFIARRGLCNTIHCDNGTNFQGAAREAKEVNEFLLTSEPALQDYLAARSITYVFNPPGAPWMGGLWEAAVKSTKRLLSKITLNRSFTFEELATLLCRVEAVLNSRPLCRTTSHPLDDPDVLTPGHFLIGAPLLSPPEHDLGLTPTNHLSRWQTVQKATQEFWRQWSNSYLQTMTVRPKWTTPRPPLTVGEPVYIIGENTPALKWPIAVVEELLPGCDGIVRKARVRTSMGRYLRPLAKLVPLPPAIPPDNPSS